MAEVISTQSVSNALKTVSPAVSKRGLDFMMCAAFQGGECLAWNGVMGVHVLNVPVKGDFAIDHAKFAALLATFRADTVRVSLDPKLMYVSIDDGGGTKVKMPYINIEDYPFQPVDKVEWSAFAEGAAAEFVKALKVALETVGADSNRGPFGSVCIGVGDKNHILSCDENRMTYVEVEHPLTEEVLVMPDFARTVVAMGPPDALGKDGRFFYARYGDTLLFTLPTQGKYPAVVKHALASMDGDMIPIPPEVALSVARARALGALKLDYLSDKKVISASTPTGDRFETACDIGGTNFSINVDYVGSAVPICDKFIPVKTVKGNPPRATFQLAGLTGAVIMAHMRE